MDMGAYEYGSFRFNIVKVEIASPGHVKLTWTSRPGDTYDVWSYPSLVNEIWTHEATVSSQGAETAWTASTTEVRGWFFSVELK